MATARFDELIPSTRLSIVAVLAAADWAEFGFMRDELDLPDSALSKQLSTLEEAGYVAIEREVRDRRRQSRAAMDFCPRADLHGKRTRRTRCQRGRSRSTGRAFW